MTGTMDIISRPVASLRMENTEFLYKVWYLHPIKTLHAKFQVSSSLGTMQMTGNHGNQISACGLAPK